MAQTKLERGNGDKAKATYRQAIEIIDRLGENNVWSQATAATACLALGDIDGARKRVLAITALGPISQDELDTICSGLREVAQRSAIASVRAYSIRSGRVVWEGRMAGAPFTHVHILAHGGRLDDSDPYSPVGVTLHDEARRRQA